MSKRFRSDTPLSPQLSRRELLNFGSLGALGLTLPKLLQAEAANSAQTANADIASRQLLPAKAKSCILFFMEGGPSHIDMWDMKPEAPENIRGIYKPIETTLPGFQVCEHLPRLAKVAHHLTVIRSVSHKIVDHNASSYYMLTGQTPFRDSRLIRGPHRENAPPYGSVLSKLRPTNQPLPNYVHLPKRMFNCGDFIPGVLAGFLGDSFDPFIAGDPSNPEYKVPGLEPKLTDAHLSERRSLLEQLDRHAGPLTDNRAMDRMSTFYDKAFTLITNPKTREAFQIDKEPEAVRRRYGLGKTLEGVQGRGLPHLGQCMLMARRLVEAGSRLVTVWAGSQAFDGHRNHYASLTQGLCPPTDQAISALIEDLSERGMLEETLFVGLSEFGRTPKLGQITSSAGANPDGRDHWPNAFTIFLAGAGVKPGLVHGKTDRLAAYPTETPVSPEDVAATIYTLMGVDPRTRLYDHLNRPHTIGPGEPVVDLFA